MPDLRLGSLDGWALDLSVTHLNHASFGGITSHISERRAQIVRDMESSPVGFFAGIQAPLSAAFEAVADDLHVTRESLVCTFNASAAASVVYSSLPLEAGSEVLVTSHGYGAITMGARRWAQRYGASLVEVQLPIGISDDDLVASVLARVSSRTAWAIIDQITSATARLFPVDRLVAELHERGVRVIVDGAHGPGIIDSPAAGDIWFGNLHKWACAPVSCAALVVPDPQLRNQLWPLIDSWNAPERYPLRFAYQGTIDYSSWLVASEAYRQLDAQLGWSEIRTYVSHLIEEGATIVAEAFGQTDRPAFDAHLTPSTSAATALSVTAQGADAHTPHPDTLGITWSPSMRLVQLPEGLGATREIADSYRVPLFEQTGIEAAFTSLDGTGYVRLSAHAYNNLADFDRFAARAVPWLLQYLR
ncbi:MAG: aminotransferase class V-fold PLP-dependent enzyme [Propionibacteriaceae bacterium]|jgi:isopenicillin-N epimerase|nr:aminotransferase class V-fold PLP-dependent enzyme [Propionibacteriaceae bacterium]